jgi:hypothetical protein
MTHSINDDFRDVTMMIVDSNLKKPSHISAVAISFAAIAMERI